MTATSLSAHSFESRHLGNTRTVWLQAAGSPDVEHVLAFLDAEYYIDGLGAPDTLAELQADGRISPLLVAYVSHIDHDVRRPESLGNARFGRFILDELMPWLVDRCARPEAVERAIAGLSLTALSAAYVALASRGTISRALCQSASFWWNATDFESRVACRSA